MQVELTVNGNPVSADVEPRLLLVHFLRDTLRLTGTHWGCDTSNCGACCVLLDGEPVKSCTVLTAMASGHEVTTIEGLSPAEGLHPLQEAFRVRHGLQCGFCTPGIILTAVAFLREHPSPTAAEIREALAGHLCRCTGYHFIVEAIEAGARAMRGEGAQSSCPGPG